MHNFSFNLVIQTRLPLSYKVYNTKYEPKLINSNCLTSYS